MLLTREDWERLGRMVARLEGEYPEDAALLLKIINQAAPEGADN